MKFKYGDKVRVTEGFYEGLILKIIRYNILIQGTNYRLEGIDNDFKPISIWQFEENLEKI